MTNLHYRRCFRPRWCISSYAAIAAIVLSSLPLAAATYYVANNGNDLADGKSPSSALATLAAAAAKLKSRDTLLLNRGDVFRDSINLAALTSPTTAPYGAVNLARPVISGGIAISQWTVYKPGVWVAPCPAKIENFYADDSLMTLARYPDTGWLRIDTMTENSDGSATVITCAALAANPRNAAGYWTNAQIRWRRWSWWFETRRIISYDPSGRLTLAGASIIHIMGTKGWGFYVDKKFEELDAPGEWYYDSTAKKVYFYPPAGKDPNTMAIEGSHAASGLILTGGTIDNVCFRHQTLSGVSISRTSSITNCLFRGIGGDNGGSALQASWDIADSHIAGNRFENNLNIGISWYENSGRLGATVIEKDTLLSTGSVPGYGGSGTWHAVGILVHLSKNVTVQNNYIDKTGYAGILLGSDSNYVQYNIIRNAMYTLNDGGAIYADCGHSFIKNNIIYDTKGDLTSSGPWYPLGHGIWLEFLGDFTGSVVENNTIVRSGCNGIYLPNNFSATVRSNVLFDNTVSQMDLDGELTNSSTGRTQNLPQNNTFQGNVCYALSRAEKTLTFRPEYDYGTMAGDYFCDPYSDSVVSGYGTGNNYYTIYDYPIARWQQLYSWADKTAKTDPFKRPLGMASANPYGKGEIFINESPLDNNLPLGTAQYKDLDGNPVSGLVSIPAFFSKILVRCDSSSGVAGGVSALSRRASFTILSVSSGRLTYFLAQKTGLVLDVYDLRGRLAFHCNIPEENAGGHSLNLALRPGSGLSRGIYYYEAAPGSVARRSGMFTVLK